MNLGNSTSRVGTARFWSSQPRSRPALAQNSTRKAGLIEPRHMYICDLSRSGPITFYGGVGRLDLITVEFSTLKPLQMTHADHL